MTSATIPTNIQELFESIKYDKNASESVENALQTLLVAIEGFVQDNMVSKLGTSTTADAARAITWHLGMRFENIKVMDNKVLPQVGVEHLPFVANFDKIKSTQTVILQKHFYDDLSPDLITYLTLALYIQIILNSLSLKIAFKSPKLRTLFLQTAFSPQVTWLAENLWDVEGDEWEKLKTAMVLITTTDTQNYFTRDYGEERTKKPAKTMIEEMVEWGPHGEGSKYMRFRNPLMWLVGEFAENFRLYQEKQIQENIDQTLALFAKQSIDKMESKATALFDLPVSPKIKLSWLQLKLPTSPAPAVATTSSPTPTTCTVSSKPYTQQQFLLLDL